jgi:DNA-binding NtrC family response regulator
MKKRILIADDESLIREYIVSFFETSAEFVDCRVDTAANGEEAIARITANDYDLVFTDLRMPGKSGLDVLKFIHEHSPHTDAVLLTAFAGGDSAAKAMSYGAREYIAKPITPEELDILVRRIFERQELIHQNAELQRQLHDRTTYPPIIGKSKVMNEIMDLVKLVAPTHSTVLITGDSGTGKELVAQAVHELSPRKDRTFIRINCAALPENLIESELFGFEKGAFTGAIKLTRGKFELADKGSILLDEISEMGLDLQAKLLRVIQEKEIMRLGSESAQKVDVRIIATSNRDLSEEVVRGRFREDLFFRLNIVPIHLPSLNKRKTDIPELIAHFIRKASLELGVPRKALAPDALEALLEYHWPGNIRELQNAVERAMITSRGNTIHREVFSFIRPLRAPAPAEPVIAPTAEPPVLSESHIVASEASSGTDFEGMTLDEIEKVLILRTLEKTGQNRTETANILGITTRTLRNKLHQYEEEGVQVGE